jgi:hypothetical protein
VVASGCRGARGERASGASDWARGVTRWDKESVVSSVESFRVWVRPDRMDARRISLSI